jgi:demethylmenaquinone methyltransferase/2-methoxy-6-polyprenyl-1,4-benzoquinol methylase
MAGILCKAAVMTQTVRADLGKRPGEVAAMFDDVAPRYDLMNDLLSLGQDRVWRRAVAGVVKARPGERILDLAAGTGTSSASFTENGATCVACDFSLGMVREGARRRGGADVDGVSFVAGDALRLPFRDAAFDAVTMSFGLRNVQDVGQALRELTRVTKPGGRLVICEFSTPVWTPFRLAYDRYLATVLPRVAKVVSSNPASYLYLSESILAWPTQSELATKIVDAGWTKVGWRNLSGGIVALHRAQTPQLHSS